MISYRLENGKDGNIDDPVALLRFYSRIYSNIMGENKLKPEETEKVKNLYRRTIFSRGKLARVRSEAHRREREMLKNTSLGDIIK